MQKGYHTCYVVNRKPTSQLQQRRSAWLQGIIVCDIYSEMERKGWYLYISWGLNGSLLLCLTCVWLLSLSTGSSRFREPQKISRSHSFLTLSVIFSGEWDGQLYDVFILKCFPGAKDSRVFSPIKAFQVKAWKSHSEFPDIISLGTP